MSRFVDRGALVAGWIGVGIALVVVIALGLIIPIPPLLIVASMPIGAAIGGYANVRSRRRWPRRRIMANALWAGAVTAVVLTAFYVGVRLLFLYLDSGRLPDDRQLDCVQGPDCVYARHVDAGQAASLAEAGIVDGATFEAGFINGMQVLAGAMLVMTISGAAVAGATQSLSGWSRRERQPEEGS